MPFYLWSPTAANNASADPTIGWAEGQAPSSINDSARAMMAATAKYRDDCNGTIPTGGSGSAYTIASNQVFDSLAHLVFQELTFVCNATNAAGCTLNVDGLGAKPINGIDGVALPAGTMISGGVYSVSYFSNGGGEFILHNFQGNAFNTPLGGMMDYICPSVPNSSFVFPIGQAISRVTYSALFGLVGTTYGVGDGSTTFNVPDLTGRITAMKEATATRLTSTYFGGNSTTLGAVGGLESSTLVTSNLPPYTPSGSVSGSATGSDTVLVSGNLQQNLASGGNGFGWSNAATIKTLTAALSWAGSFAGSAQGGTSTPVRTVPPMMIVQKILRII